MKRRVTIIALALILAVFVLACGSTEMTTDAGNERRVLVQECMDTNGGRACHDVMMLISECIAKYGHDFCVNR